jgi:hypothetical protein
MFLKFKLCFKKGKLVVYKRKKIVLQSGCGMFSGVPFCL